MGSYDEVEHGRCGVRPTRYPKARPIAENGSAPMIQHQAEG